MTQLYKNTGLFFLALSMATHACSQKEVANWFFGTVAIDFNCNPPMPYQPDPSFYSVEGSSSISDSLGNLLFYTDGNRVWDKNHAIMPNGYDIGQDSLCAGSSTQGALIVKQPEQDSIYYIFTTDCAENYLANGMSYSIVNMNMNGGNGAVTLKKQNLVPTACEKLAAVRSFNGTDLWIVTHEWGNADFFAYRLTAIGLNTVPVISSTGRIQLPNTPATYPECAARGHLKFSPQGDKIAVMSASDCHGFVAYPEIFSFDNQTGVVTYEYTLNTQDSTSYYAGSFSPNGDLLYLSAGWYGVILHQFDLTSGDSTLVSNSKYVVYEYDGWAYHLPAGMQIGPNGKIYNATHSPFLNIIHNPNVYGAGCNFEEGGLQLNTCSLTYSEFGLPNNDESIYLNSFTGNSCEPSPFIGFDFSDGCANDTIQFTDISNVAPTTITSWYWNFGDWSGPDNTSTLQNPVHVYSNPGIYTVSLNISADSSENCYLHGITHTIEIDCVLGTNQQDQSAFFSLYPNPAQTETILKTDHYLDNCTVTLYNAVGQQVSLHQNVSGHSLVIDCSNLSAGVYVITLSGNDFSPVVNKLVISDY